MLLAGLYMALVHLRRQCCNHVSVLQVISRSIQEQSLFSWLSLQCKLLSKGALSSGRAAQLLALGVKPEDAIGP